MFSQKHHQAKKQDSKDAYLVLFYLFTDCKSFTQMIIQFSHDKQHNASIPQLHPLSHSCCFNQLISVSLELICSCQCVTLTVPHNKPPTQQLHNKNMRGWVDEKVRDFSLTKPVRFYLWIFIFSI